jgi:hypothetical protein
MRAVSKWVSAIGFSLCVFATSLMFQPVALALEAGEFQAAVAAFNAKLEEANRVNGDINQVVHCLGDEEERLRPADSTLEGVIGYAAAEEKKWEIETKKLDPKNINQAIPWGLAEAQRLAARHGRIAAEKLLTDVRQSLSDINNARQPLGIEIVEFENALTQAGKVNQADERPRTLRKLQDIAGKIDGILERSRVAVSRSKQLIPAEKRQACKVS